MTDHEKVAMSSDEKKISAIAERVRAFLHSAHEALLAVGDFEHSDKAFTALKDLKALEQNALYLARRSKSLNELGSDAMQILGPEAQRLGGSDGANFIFGARRALDLMGVHKS